MYPARCARYDSHRHYRSLNHATVQTLSSSRSMIDSIQYTRGEEHGALGLRVDTMQWIQAVPGPPKKVEAPGRQCQAQSSDHSLETG